MYIYEVELNGFKSYSNKTVIGPFSSHFNAITGLNGSGKSNVFDALCFVFGIEQLDKVRVTRLEDFIYKQGQANIDKATVTVTFKRSPQDKATSSDAALFAEGAEFAKVTRQVIKGGRERYLVNSTVKRPKDVKKMFNDASLNINNPHFMILQGRITDVVNFSPKQVLRLIEEGIGTQRYADKRTEAIKLMQGKENKLQDIDNTLTNDVVPRIDGMRKERQDFIQWGANNEEIEELEKKCATIRFDRVCHALINGERHLNSLIQEQKNCEDQIDELDRAYIEYQATKASILENEPKEREPLERAIEEKEAIEKAMAKRRSNEKLKRKDKQAEATNLLELEKELKRVEKKLNDVFTANKADATNLSELEKKCNESKEELAKAERLLEAITTGAVSDNPQSLREQLISQRSKLSGLEGSIFKQEQLLRHLRSSLEDKEKLLQEADKESQEQFRQRDKLEEGLKMKQQQLQQLSQCDGGFDALKIRRGSFLRDIERAKEVAEEYLRKLGNLFINVQLPPNFDPRRFHGQIFEIIELKKEFHFCALALQQLVGKNLPYVVVDSKEDGAAIHEHNKFAKGRKRVTIWPLRDGVIGRYINQGDVEQCRRLVGSDLNDNKKLICNYEMLEYESPKYDKLVQYVFGKSFVCADARIAQAISYSQGPGKKWQTATLDGDVFNPSGSMSGGSSRIASQTLILYSQYKEKKRIVDNLIYNMSDVDKEFALLNQRMEQIESLKTQIELDTNEMHNLELSLSRSDGNQHRESLLLVKRELTEVEAQLASIAEERDNTQAKVLQLEAEINDIEQNNETREEEVRANIKASKAALKANNANLNKKQQSMSWVRIELEKLQREVDQYKEDSEAKKLLISNISEAIATEVQLIEEDKAAIKKLEQSIVALQANLTEVLKKASEAESQMEAVEKRKNHFIIELKRVTHQVDDSSEQVFKSKERVSAMQRQYSFLQSRFDELVAASNLETSSEAAASSTHRNELDERSLLHRLEELKQTQNRLFKNINTTAPQHFSEAEKHYDCLVSRREIVKTDRSKLQSAINYLDDLRMKTLESAIHEVNRYFSRIFSELLPNAQAQLVAADGKALDDPKATLFEGLEMKVGFNGKWRESLSELSGGQRSLLALSLVLALLKRKPAPFYILDEIDAALDLSHTQNIGTMFRSQFSDSQFIVVSLKDGMFSQADVIFRTEFVDGASTVQRFNQITAGASNKRKLPAGS